MQEKKLKTLLCMVLFFCLQFSFKKNDLKFAWLWMKKKSLRVPSSNQICNLHNTFVMYYGCSMLTFRGMFGDPRFVSTPAWGICSFPLMSPDTGRHYQLNYSTFPFPMTILCTWSEFSFDIFSQAVSDLFPFISCPLSVDTNTGDSKYN